MQCISYFISTLNQVIQVTSTMIRSMIEPMIPLSVDGAQYTNCVQWHPLSVNSPHRYIPISSL